ncbi:PAPA-1 domain-containing protein [Mycena venus]|uniref:PAPA-1 domain-containing protein n=1 Tax=Mycena venus TaxID=2733690 RepID=A0A8H6XK79_9AGAR|nr:PAPA-1 domain-containing protein [Mycena venus]
MPTVASEESEVDIEVEEMQYSSDVDEEPVEEEEEAGEDELEESDNDEADAQSTGAGHNGPLKIKLKLGAQVEKPTSRRYARARNEDIESEDSDSDDSQSNSYAPAATTSRQLTARQAVLASAGGPSHITLDTSTAGSSKKRQLPASEVALRKEENARKRKNMIEKKLEDEKAETINRLLKKQSRPKNKRAAAAAVQSDEDVDMDEEEEPAGGGGGASALRLPMYRWVSTSRPPQTAMPVTETEPPVTSIISFSVPESFLPSLESESQPPHKVIIQVSTAVAQPEPGRERCAVEGCEEARKYRAVGKAWGVGACGMGHLRVLEGRA